MHGLILAGGRGSRLAADGVETPKALVEIAGQPQIVHLIRTFAALGCQTITCMVRDDVRFTPPPALRASVRYCHTPSSLHTLVAGLAALPPGPVFCAMVDTVMPPADWRRLHQGVTQQLDMGSVAVLAVTPFVDDELPLYVARNADGFATAIMDSPPPGNVVVTGGVYGFSPEARRLAAVAVASLHRMRAYLKLLVELRLPVATVEVPRIIDLDHKRDLEAAESWLTQGAGDREPGAAR
ncbi:MAG TPA: NTP transferase domain-containing protein [Gemmatimonadales bacterium]|jgi:NDP-sugar pyrophosphorylase family protein|nr:NTP transferase domain-containing protein [Gemmatimonadales bacterium]